MIHMIYIVYSIENKRIVQFKLDMLIFFIFLNSFSLIFVKQKIINL